MPSLPTLRLRARKFAGHALAWLLVIATLPTGAAPSVRAQDGDAAQDPASLPLVPVIAPGSAYRQRNLVSDLPGVALVEDPLLINPWGISLTATSPFWVANTGSGTTQLLRGDVGGSPLVLNPGLSTVTLPGVPVSLPTGTVANTTNDFVITSGSASGPARFIFAHITGHITGWNPNVPAAGSTTGVIASSPPGGPFSRIYTGLAIGIGPGPANFIYAADVLGGKIDTFDRNFALQSQAAFPFARDPAIPANYHPFNIQNTGGFLYVTYALVDPMTGLDIEGVGNGYVRRFNAAGQRDATFAINNGALNSPWAVTVAPATFGIFGGALLVGNFGRGNPSIHAYNPTTGAFLGTLQDESGQGIRIDELWDLKFGNGVAGGDANTLYFAAGIANETHGLFGALNPTTATATSLVQFSSDDYAISEGAGHIDITVTRAGDASGTATVNYATFDDETPGGHASQKSDYELAAGSLTFAAGETSKTFRVLLVDDRNVEGTEHLYLAISNPTGAGVGLGNPNVVEVDILDNDGAPTTANPIDESGFFVRQHYLDFLNREPDAAGLAFWVNNIESCGGDAACRAIKRIDTSAAFFLSQEFQRTGYLAYLTHRAAFGMNAPGSPAPVLYGNMMRDTQALQRGFVVGQTGAEAVLEANKVAFFNEFVTRPEFVSRYPSTQTNAEYVDALLRSANLSPDDFIVNMTNAQEPPPINPTTTTGTPRPRSYGTARFVFNAGRTALTLTGTVNNIDFTGSQTADTNDNLTNAHIHASAADPPPATRGVVFGFIGTPFNDNNPNDAVVTPFASGVGGTFSSKWDAPEGQNTTLAAQLPNLLAGRAYINFHTVQFGGGEVRGNFPALQTFRDSLVAGLNDGTLTRATVLRMVAEAQFLHDREKNAAFVAMQYFGYLRRNPDTSGFSFWLQKLNEFGGDFRAAEMVKSFIISEEYRERFGPS